MIARLGVLVFFLMRATTTLAAFPSIHGDASRPECIDALTLAREMFNSTSQRTYAPLKIPPNLQSKFVLGATELDISGGNALTSTEDFEKIPHDLRNIYWAKETNGSTRIILQENSFSWHGDSYTLYLLNARVTKNEFLEDINSTAKKKAYQPIWHRTWRPPLFFQLPDLAEKWFIDVVNPYEILPDWSVYSPKDASEICRITFKTPGGNPTALLPSSVRKLARKLDEALGPELYEGTLHPTDRIRMETQQVMANAAVRPWALFDGDAYNSRSEVDAGLKDWAKITPQRRQLYADILRLYPIAERSLENYYRSKHGLPKHKAQEVATWAIDLLFRAFFVFHSEQSHFANDIVRTNPWPLSQ